MKLKTPICELFKIDYPVFLAGMGGVAYAEICAAVSAAGGYGTLGMAGVPPEQIREQMLQVKEITDKPFGVDLLVAIPEQVEAAIDVIIDEGASAFIGGLGVPRRVIEKCHEANVKVMSMCGKVAHAVDAANAGCDVVIAQGTEGGGHTGQVAGMALIPQIVDAVDVPVIAAGSIFDGRGLTASLAFGAQGAWIGTRFIASEEAHAALVYKQHILDAQSDQTVISRCYSGKPMRVIRNDYVDDWSKRPEDLKPFPQQMLVSIQNATMGLLAGLDGDIDPDKACMPAGQGAGGIHEILSAKEIITRIMSEAEDHIIRMGDLIQ